VRTTVLEKHADFLRDFRGDTVHASTLTLLDELGLGQQFAALPPRWLEKLTVEMDSGRYAVADLTRLPGHHQHIAFVPQWDFLNVVADASRQEPSYELIMEAEVTDLLWDGQQVTGVRYRRGGEDHLLEADLVVGCDGRFSVSAERAGLRLRTFGVPMDVLWFRLPRFDTDPEGALGRISRSNFLIMIDRGDYFQIGFVIRKGSITTLRDHGIAAFRQRLRDVVPWLGDRVELLQSFDDIRLLNVVLSRLPRWYRPGLLCIGDAAHAMSPVGGVGINLAVQDAVAGGRILAQSLRLGRVPTTILRRVQRRRWLPTVITQAFQRVAHRVVVAASIADDEAGPRPTIAPVPLRMMQRFPLLQAIPGYFIGIGLLPEHAPNFARARVAAHL
jgi:2-polyprenyl-6-methoxyphenol hydroxylase-like FAD-dependent oxidoreductase